MKNRETSDNVDQVKADLQSPITLLFVFCCFCGSLKDANSKYCGVCGKEALSVKNI